MFGRQWETPIPTALRSAGLECGVDYVSETFSARGPFGPSPIVNFTLSPSRMELNGVSVHAEWWKKYSVPSDAAMKPKPLSVMRLIVPVVDVMCESFDHGPRK